MQVLSPDLHRLLNYIDAVQRQGYTLTVHEFQRYAASPTPKRGRTAWRGTSSVGAQVGKFLAALPIDVIEEPETIIDYLRRVGWIDTPQEDQRKPTSPLRITDLGRAVLRHSEQQATEDDSDLTIVLDPDDPFSYARVIGRIADLGEGLLVDAYFGLAELNHIAFRTSLTRVLTSKPKDKTGDVAALTTALESMTLDRYFEVRAAPRTEIHDRYVIADVGRVHFIGTSLSGVGKKPSAMGEIHGRAAEAIRKLHEDIWNSADPLIQGINE